jgi:hypothetical protein
MTLQQYVERCQAVPDFQINDRSSNVYTGLWGGQYARFLTDWLQAFPGRCDVVFFDDLIADPVQTVSDQCGLLGIDRTGAVVSPEAENPSAGYRSPSAQRVAAMAAKRSRAVFRRYPGLYTSTRRVYEAINQRAAEQPPTAEAARRVVSAIYRPWNDLLAQQLRDAGIGRLPPWLD